ATTVADAYLTPRLAAYLRSLATGTARRGLPVPLVMQSSGGVVELEVAAAHAAGAVLSGPAGGVVGAAYVAGLSGEPDVLTFDMGGTSTDVAGVRGGRVPTTTEAVVAGVPIKLPAVDVHSVSAGGGSVAWVDEGGALRVGPRSAGADPGPVSYRRGGTEPTVTDADLVLGHLADGATLGGEVRLSRAAAVEALGALGARLGLSAARAAAGVVAVADAEMVRALRVVSVERGLDPRELALVAFGGAGGTHACALAEELGIRRVLVPLACGVLSALGLALGDVRRDYARPLFGPVGEVGTDRPFAELSERARRDLPGAELARFADCRYAGQSYELTVPADDPAARFGAEHERRYGWRADDRPVEVVALRVVATVPGRPPELSAPPADPAARRGRRRALVGDAWAEVEVVPRAALGPGDAVRGPAVVDFAEATCVLRPGWTGTVDGAGTLVLER
ncbi:MAG TPA: hydantoinase/oxoprolinase family protein, partial [Frankiaceae bacterium]|nr:hydantoinase/oxoprolinase family protein [Frankiaceae bacterium]